MANENSIHESAPFIGCRNEEIDGREVHFCQAMSALVQLETTQGRVELSVHGVAPHNKPTGLTLSLSPEAARELAVSIISAAHDATGSRGVN